MYNNTVCRDFVPIAEIQADNLVGTSLFRSHDNGGCQETLMAFRFRCVRGCLGGDTCEFHRRYGIADGGSGRVRRSVWIRGECWEVWQLDE